MTAPAPGFVRVLPVAGVGGLRPGRWVDVRRDDPLVREWVDAGLVRFTATDGSPPPENLTQPCCGG